MTSLSVRLATFPLLLSLGACGGETIGIDPKLFEPPQADGGPGSGSGSGSDPRNDAGAPLPEDAAPPGQPTGEDAGPGTPPRGGDAGAGGACESTAGCASGTQCAWPVSEDICIAFNPLGTCVVPNNEACNAVVQVTGCGCNGMDVEWTTGCVGLPSGWAPVGLAHAGSCAGGPDGGVACTTSADCDAGSICVSVSDLQLGTSSSSCEPNPCGTSPLSCDCASSVCNGTGGSCFVADGGVIDCESMG